MGAEGARVEELNVIIVGEAGHGGHGVASRVEVGGGNKCGNNTSATSGEDAEEGIFGGGEFFRFETEAVGLFASFGGFFGSCGSSAGFGVFEKLRAIGEADFCGGALTASGDGMRN